MTDDNLRIIATTICDDSSFKVAMVPVALRWLKESESRQRVLQNTPGKDSKKVMRADHEVRRLKTLLRLLDYKEQEPQGKLYRQPRMSMAREPDFKGIDRSAREETDVSRERDRYGDVEPKTDDSTMPPNED